MKKLLAWHVVLPLLCAVIFHFVSGNPPFTILRYYGSDFAWAYACTASLLIIWNGRIPLVLLFLLLAVFILIELLQFRDILAGHGDSKDVMIYVAGAILACVFLLPFLLKLKKDEPA